MDFHSSSDPSKVSRVRCSDVVYNMQVRQRDMTEEGLKDDVTKRKLAAESLRRQHYNGRLNSPGRLARARSMWGQFVAWCRAAKETLVTDDNEDGLLIGEHALNLFSQFAVEVGDTLSKSRVINRLAAYKEKIG